MEDAVSRRLARYDANSRLRTITQAPLNPVTIEYDPSNRRTSLVLPNGVSTEYQYDLASRLTALIYRNALGQLGDLQYTYDAAGNRVNVGGSFARTLLPDAVPSAAYDQGNRQLAFGGSTMTFDDNGNLLTQTDPSGTLTYTWDARNRLTAMNGPSVSGSFAYDSFGRRARKTVDSLATEFLYDELDAVREIGGGGDASYVRTLNIDEALVRTDAVDTVHFLADALGSTMALTDSTGGATTTYTYEPFGRTAVDGTGINAFQYTGRENDGTGLYYYRARYYDPGRRRFVSEDPKRNVGDVNLYRYAFNSPVWFVDPSGLDVTVTLYNGAWGFGHIGVGVNATDSTDTMGHYPLDRSISVPASVDVGGAIEPDMRHKSRSDVIDTITITRSPSQDAAMLRVIEENRRQNRYYNLGFRNCASFVEDVLRAGGVGAGDDLETNRPWTLMERLQRRYGNPVPLTPNLPGGFAP